MITLQELAEVFVAGGHPVVQVEAVSDHIERRHSPRLACEDSNYRIGLDDMSLLVGVPQSAKRPLRDPG